MTNNADYTPLCIYTTLGIPLILSYISLYQQPKSVINNFWSNNNQNNIKKYGIYYLYTISIILSAISGIYLLYYLTNGMTNKKIFGMNYKDNGKYVVYVALLLFIGFSLVWIPSFYMYDKKTFLSKYLLGFVLFMVSVGAGLLLATIISASSKITNDAKIAILASSYLTFHTFILDFIVWNGFL